LIKNFQLAAKIIQPTYVEDKADLEKENVHGISSIHLPFRGDFFVYKVLGAVIFMVTFV
jgi:UDP-N-acetylmuramyl tripeptide synthase